MSQLTRIDLSRLTVEELQELDQTLRKRERAIQDAPILFYKPHKKQELVHYSEARWRFFLGGNRSGKTTYGANEGIAHAIGFRPWLPEDDPNYWVRDSRGRKIRVPNTGIILGESYTSAISLVLWPTVEKWIPKELIARKILNQARAVCAVELTNGSVIRFWSYNMDPKEMEGAAYHWVWYDEPPPQSRFEAVERGLVDYSGRSWFTCTPIREPWVADMAYRDDPKIYTVEVESQENPYVGKEELEEYFESIADPKMREARRTGKALHLQGRIFAEWEAKPPFFVPAGSVKLGKYWPRVRAIDPHPVKPIAVVWAAISPQTGIWYVYRDLFDPELKTVAEVSEYIQHVEHENDEHTALSVIDPSSRENERTSDTSVHEEFERHGIDCELAQRWDKQGRIEIMHRFLKIDKVFRVPRLIVFDNCRRVKFEFENYVWDEWQISASKQEKEPKGLPREKDNDCLDGLMYLLQAGENAVDFSADEEDGKSYFGARYGRAGEVAIPKRPASRTGY